MGTGNYFEATVVCCVATLAISGLWGCQSAQSAKRANSEVSASTPVSSPSTAVPGLRHAIELLGESVKKPNSSFHLSLKAVDSDSAYEYEADISPEGITGKSTEGTLVKNWNGTPMGSDNWRGVAMAVLSPLPYNQLELAQPGVKYVADESVGGYNTRRYDFDLAGVPVSDKNGALLGTNAVGSMVGAQRTLKDYNVKGSAWIAKEDGRMVKTVYDYLDIFSDGSQQTSHHEVSATAK